MGQNAAEKNRDDDVPTAKKLDDLYKLIDGIETAMLTTRRPDGYLVSRAMQTQKRTSGTDLWFVTGWYADKLDEIALDPHVSVTYYKDRTRDWVSVSGKAIITRDRDLVRGLYKPDWKAWFPNEGGAKDGGPDDPRITLILVEAHTVTYSKTDRPMPMVLFELVKGMVTGTAPKVADLRTVSEQELRSQVKGASGSEAR
ncbi:MAG TPA: pyridoxamine 5'-phosphate oxidase family protein [Gemmatimonadaceae bacterium]|nr:pyridoxamine 5'-phosphate oxidase family protein [Gemmatimonadaceae bacterium]